MVNSGRKGWTRAQKISLAGVIVAAAGIIPGILVKFYPRPTPPSEAAPQANTAVQVANNVANGIGVVNTGTMTLNMGTPGRPTPPRPDVWKGESTESLIDGDRKWALMLRCNCENSTFTGSSDEPGFTELGEIKGSVNGDSVRFTKTNEGGYKTLFTGTLNRTEKTIQGTWTSGNKKGTFMLHRSPEP
jgi:hypothetical protein